MPQRGGRPKGSARCQPGTVEIRLDPNVRGGSGRGLHAWYGPAEDMADWQRIAARRVADALTILESAQRQQGMISAQYELGYEDAVDADVRIAGLLASGVHPDRLRAALLQLGTRFATANLNADGALTLRASSVRGPKSEASSAELAHALSCLPGFDYLFAPREADLYLAAAPTAKSYVDLVASIPLLRDELDQAVGQPATEFATRQQKLIDRFYAGELSLEALLEQDQQNSREARAALEAAAAEARLKLAGLPASSVLYTDLMLMVDGRVEKEAVTLLPLSNTYWEKVYGSWSDDDDSGDDFAGLDEAGRLEKMRDDRWQILEFEWKRVGDLLPQAPSGTQARWSEMLPLVDGYVANLQRPGLTGNEAASRKMAAGMLDGVLAQHGMAELVLSKRVMGGWDGTTPYPPRVSGGVEHRLNTEHRYAFMAESLPWVHDFKGPYEGVSPTPVIVALAPYLDDVGAAQLAGVMSVRDGWQEQSVRDMVSVYGSTRADAERHVQRAAERLGL
jgi:hypothetical protein